MTFLLFWLRSFVVTVPLFFSASRLRPAHYRSHFNLQHFVRAEQARIQTSLLALQSTGGLLIVHPVARSLTIRYRKLTRGVRYFWRRSSKDRASPDFTSSISWTSDLAMAPTFYRTRGETKSCKCLKCQAVEKRGQRVFAIRRRIEGEETSQTFNQKCNPSRISPPKSTISAIRAPGSRLTQ